MDSDEILIMLIMGLVTADFILVMLLILPVINAALLVLVNLYGYFYIQHLALKEGKECVQACCGTESHIWLN